MYRNELIRWVSEEQMKWELLLAAIGGARLAQAGVNGDWSMRDVIAHLTGWQRLLVGKFQAAIDGNAEPSTPWSAEITDEDEINAWIYETNRGRTVREVLDDAAAVHEDLLTALKRLSDDARVETIQGKFHVVYVGEQRFAVGEFFYHFYDDHLADVLAWLKREKQAQLLR